MIPLAHRIRPKSFKDIYGQIDLVGQNGIITKMVENNKLFSLILHGEPGTGKTTIANILTNYYDDNFSKFNASNDNKAKLKKIIDDALSFDEYLLIIDEIHRMKKDIQDYLLPHVENGTVTIIGITTENPYIAVNPAIRSRCHILKVRPLNKKDIKKALITIKDEYFPDKKFNDDVFDYLSDMSNGELRTAINCLEILTITDYEQIDLNYAELIIQRPAFRADKDGNNYYNYLSGLQKSIRGSDVNAAIYYLAKLLIQDDLTSLCRRLKVIAYEDISIANPQIGPRVMAACQAAIDVGMPEARLPLVSIVTEMALSPKSNTPHEAIAAIDNLLNKGIDGEIPSYIKPGPLQKNYKYPFDYEGNYVVQNYLPDALKNIEFIKFTNESKFESAMKERYESLRDIKKSIHKKVK